jgi:hypothetical protein
MADPTGPVVETPVATGGRRPVLGPFAWHGRELARSDGWRWTWPPSALAEIDAAVRTARARGVPLLEITRDDFPLPGCASLFADLRRELEHGRGLVLFHGLPAEAYEEEDLRLILWGVGAHLGVAVSQSKNGEFLGEVRDLGVVLGRPDSRGYRTKQHLRFHTDRCDVVVLLCVRTAKAGGLSRVVSSVAIHNEILIRRPDLLEVLYQTYHHGRQGEEAPGEDRSYPNPIFGVRDGLFTSQYSRSYVESAQRFPEVPRLTAQQNEALDLLAALAEELAVSMELAPGDLQFLNSHVTYHSRTEYEDHPQPSRQRLLLRLWLSMPGSRPLPDGFEVLWGRIEPGAIRGGVMPQSGWRDVVSSQRAIRERSASRGPLPPA